MKGTTSTYQVRKTSPRLRVNHNDDKLEKVSISLTSLVSEEKRRVLADSKELACTYPVQFHFETPPAHCQQGLRRQDEPDSKGQIA